MRGHQLRPALSAIGMCSRLVCQLPADGHLTAAMTHIAAVNTHTADTSHRRSAPSSHVNNYMQKMIAEIQKCFVTPAIGRGASKETSCSRLFLLAHLLRQTLTATMKKAKRRWLFRKNIKKKSWQIAGCTPLAYTALSTFGCKCHGEGLTHFLCHCSERIFSFVCTNPPMGEDELQLSSLNVDREDFLFLSLFWEGEVAYVIHSFSMLFWYLDPSHLKFADCCSGSEKKEEKKNRKYKNKA